MGEKQNQQFATRDITLSDITEAYDRIAPYTERTPVFESTLINQEHGRKFYFKCENMQRTGSFKIRGAINAALAELLIKPMGWSTSRFDKEQPDGWVGGNASDITLQHLKSSKHKSNGLITQSSGNHGIAVALAAKTCGLKCVVVTPRTTPQYKLDGIKSYGAELVLCEPTMESRLKTCHEVQEKRGYHYISSGDDYDVITGQATIGYEFLSQVPDLDAILVTVSGGGMAAGSCLATQFLKPGCKVFAAEPPGKDLEKCLRAGKRLWPDPPQYLDTVAEGLRVQQIGHRGWPILLDRLQRDVFTVQDEDTIRGLQYAFKMLKVILEPSAGTAVAAALSPKMKGIAGLEKIGVVLCGGNVDIDKLPIYLEGVNDVTFS